jgi:hypothetical protein
MHELSSARSSQVEEGRRGKKEPSAIATHNKQTLKNTKTRCIFFATHCKHFAVVLHLGGSL